MSTQASDRVANRLIHATSPYLLQHAHNPVDWFEWGAEALNKAKEEDKPILVSIGYSSCHWCHVMERESFESHDIAAIMNEHFVCIKVDREERPDIDQVYMDAVQALGIHGGWPLNVFLAPDHRPFYGGTYFPPANWSRLLLQISRTFKEKRKEISESAEQLHEHLNTSDLQRFAGGEQPFTAGDYDAIFQSIETKFDPQWGGLDKAPKFVMPSIWRWLLLYTQMSGSNKAREMVMLTLKRLASGGIYDQVGGGFSRYSVDGEWFAPHFEKMLYDNAQLLSLYSEAYRTNPDPLFRRVAYETTEWLRREMRHPQGGFYSALDADSEGVEGKFYTWTYEELKNALGGETEAAAKYFHAVEDGNWEHTRNILYRDDSTQPALTDDQVKHIQSTLLEVRKGRVRPSLDDKILAGWNAMTIEGLLNCYNAFGDHSFLELALENVKFLESNLIGEGRCFRSFRGKRNATEGFLEDHAFVINAFLALYHATFDEGWIAKAEKMCEYVVTNFWDDKEGYFFFAGSNGEKLIARKKEVFDNVIPSSNSVMARNLFHLGALLDRDEWKQMSTRMVTALRKIIVGEPSYASNWATLALELSADFSEIAITGPRALEVRHELLQKRYFLGMVLGTSGPSNLPLLRDKAANGKTTIYVCYDKACRQPVHSAEEAIALLKQPKN